MTEFINVVLLSGAMFFGCLISGYVPLMFTLSQKSIQRCTILGAGLLVGTALAVIIPEGVDVMYKDLSQHHHVETHSTSENEELGFLQRKVKGAVSKEASEFHEKDGSHIHEHDHEKENIHQAVGASLLLGFIFMLLVDQIGGSHNHSHTHENVESGNQNKPKPTNSGKSVTATLGLVVHAAADGIALGAAASTSKTDLQIIVFLAIMLHKAPAAFGLVSFLMHENIEKRRIKTYLLVFATAAPLLAIVTFLELSHFKGLSNMTMNGTGIAMLFSGGTFLYVSTVHVLPEVSHSSSGLSKEDVICLLIGAAVPLLLNFTHNH